MINGHNNCSFWNVYGPSECTCISNAVRVDPEAINYYAEPFYHLGKVLDHFEAEIDYNELSQDQDRQVGELILLGKSVGKVILILII